MKILVVDDDESQGILVSRLLTRESHEIVLKDTLGGGLAELIQGRELGGVITDWCLVEETPKVYGVEIVRKAVELGLGVAVRSGTDDETGQLNRLIAELKEKGIKLAVWSKEWDLGRTIEAVRGLVEGRVGGGPERGR